jgi:hypothetical protein
MSALQDILGRILKAWEDIPTATTPMGAFPETFDAAAFDTGKSFVRSMEEEIALVKQLDDPVASAEFENTHPRMQLRLLNAINKLGRVNVNLAKCV